jgi:hypothetical protein
MKARKKKYSYIDELINKAKVIKKIMKYGGEYVKGKRTN